MLNFNELPQITTAPAIKVLTGQVIDTEGSCLIYVTDGVEGAVRMSQGNANERFYGVSISQTMNAISMPTVQEEVGSQTRVIINLARTPDAAGSISVQNVATGALLASQVNSVAVDATGEFFFDAAANTIEVDVADQDVALKIVFTYAPTVADLRELQGDQLAGVAPVIDLGVVGAIQKGLFQTSEYDTSVAWVIDAGVHTGANGKFTIAGNGEDLVAKVFVRSLPTTANPFLGLEIV